MRAVRARDHRVEVVEIDAPSGDGVRVRVGSAGICGSDLHLLAMWPLQATLGHEFAGYLADGTPVAVEPIAPCGECEQCLSADYHRCALGPAITMGVGRDGGMADECLVPASSIVRLPSGLEVGDACLVEPMAVAVHGFRRGSVRTSDRIAIVGGGTIGQCAVATARSVGSVVDIETRHDRQREAADRLGAGQVGDGGYDVVIDAAGTTSALERCVRLAKPGGRMILLGSYWEGMQLNGFELCMKEITVIPSAQYNRSGPSRDIDVAAALLADAPDIASAVITHRFPLDAAGEAFTVAADRSSGAIKVVLEP